MPCHTVMCCTLLSNSATNEVLICYPAIPRADHCEVSTLHDWLVRVESALRPRPLLPLQHSAHHRTADLPP